MNSRFRDRREAGHVLAHKLDAYARKSDTLVLGLPRGGIPVAFEVARTLRAPLDVFLVRKLGVPGHEELAMGAIAAGGTRLINWEVVEDLGVSEPALQAVIRKEERELERREQLYRGSSPRPSVAARVVILVDDGLATGSTMRVAVTALREQRPARIVVGVPIAPPSICEELADLADDVQCAITTEPFYSVSLWYEDFSQTTDNEVRELLALAAHSLIAAEQDATHSHSKGGQEMNMKVRDLMTTNVVFATTDAPLSRAAQLMWECDCGAVPVVQEGSTRVVGMITDRDICMATWSKDRPPSAIAISEAMSQALFDCAPDDGIASAERLMRVKQIRRIPVVNSEGNLVGILSLADIVAQSQSAGTRRNELELAPNEIAATLANICQPRQTPVERDALS